MRIKNDVAIAYQQKKMLYQLRPDILPPFLCDVERELWGFFFERLKNG